MIGILQQDLNIARNDPALNNTKYDTYFLKAGRIFDIEPHLLKTLAYHESRFNPNARGDIVEGRGTSHGLMQINDVTFDHIKKVYSKKYPWVRDMKMSDIYNPEKNIKLGAAAMRLNLIHHKNDMNAAIRQYMGSGGRSTPQTDRFLYEVLEMKNWVPSPGALYETPPALANIGKWAIPAALLLFCS